MSEQSPYDAGYAAYPRGQNPYEPGSDTAYEWYTGKSDAAVDHEEAEWDGEAGNCNKDEVTDD